MSFPTSSPHALHQSHGGQDAVEENYEVYFGDVQTLCTHTHTHTHTHIHCHAKTHHVISTIPCQHKRIPITEEGIEITIITEIYKKINKNT